MTYVVEVACKEQLLLSLVDKEFLFVYILPMLVYRQQNLLVLVQVVVFSLVSFLVEMVFSYSLILF